MKTARATEGIFKNKSELHPLNMTAPKRQEFISLKIKHKACFFKRKKTQLPCFRFLGTKVIFSQRP